MEENFYDDYDYEDMAADIRSINASRAGSVNSAVALGLKGGLHEQARAY